MSLDRVKKLIELAASTNIEEARTAAYHACRLIRELDLDVSVKRTEAEAIRDSFAKPSDPEARTGTSVRMDAVAAPATSTGFCVVCFSMYYFGDKVLFLEGLGVVHDGCKGKAVSMQEVAKASDERRQKTGGAKVPRGRWRR